MNTSFWGPDAWNMLHTIAEKCPPKMSVSKTNKIRKFYQNLVHILPCKYCRMSLKDFYQQLPINNYLDSGKCIRYWLYLIHNKVNNKLRQQGECNWENPTAKNAFNKYKNYIDQIGGSDDSCLNLEKSPGWDFTYCICLNYRVEKKMYYKRYFTHLAGTYPCKKIAKAYQEYLKSNPIKLNNCIELTRWFYKFDKLLKHTNLTFKETYKKYSLQKAGCNQGTCKLR